VEIPSHAPAPARASPKSDPLLGLGLDSVELDVDVLRQLKKTSEDNLHNLMNVLAGMQSAVKAEQLQLDRIDFAIEKAKRQARYAEADRIAKRRGAEDGSTTRNDTASGEKGNAKRG
jgi:hypothetical protein